MSEWFEDYGYAAVGDGLVVGAMPGDRQDVERLAALGIERVYNLVEDGEYRRGRRSEVERALAEAGIEERRLPLVDYGDLELEKIEQAVNEIVGHLEAGERVYLHCRAGWQRSAAVAAAVIAVREGRDILDALRVLAQRKPTAAPLDHQREAVLEWWERRDGS